jgi:hypothetical protein
MTIRHHAPIPGLRSKSPLAGFAPLHHQLRDPGKVILKAVPNIPNLSPT